MKFSVLIHNLNRADILAECLDSVAIQDYRPLEVVILDAGSTDGSLEVIDRARADLAERGVETKFKSVPYTGVAQSRNMAAREATGQILFIMDNDALLGGPDHLSKLAALFRGWPELAVVGVRILERNLERLDPHAWIYRRPQDRWREKTFAAFTFAGGGFAARTEDYWRVGGFWEALPYSREEEEMAVALLDRGRRIIYYPEVFVRHFPHSSGRVKSDDRMFMELVNGLLIFWRRLPLPWSLAAGGLRLGLTTLRAIRRRTPLRPLLKAVPEAIRTWRRGGWRRRQVSQAAARRYFGLQFGHALPALDSGPNRVDILDCPFDPVSQAQVVDRIRRALLTGQRLHIAPCNVDCVIQAQTNRVYKTAWLSAQLVVADGVPILWAAELLGRPLPGRVNGTDLCLACARLSAESGLEAVIVGADPAITTRGAARLEQDFPGAKVTALPTPYPLTDQDSRRLAEEIKNRGAKMILVALGSAKQEEWIRRWLDLSGAPVGVGVGGSFEMISGEVGRAPEWMQKNGLEWLFRLIKDPRRLAKRYLIDDPPFFWKVFNQAARERLRPGGGD